MTCSLIARHILPFPSSKGCMEVKYKWAIADFERVQRDDACIHFIKLFIDKNFKKAFQIANYIGEKDKQVMLKSAQNEEEQLLKMLKMLNQNHAKIGNSFVGKFIKEIQKIFGKKNTILIGFMTKIESEFLLNQNFSACYEFSLWQCQIMKEFIQITGEKNLSVIGLLYFKLAKLERLMDRVDQAHIFADLGLNILKNYFDIEEIRDLYDIKNESIQIINRFGINLESKKSLLVSKYYPSI